MKIKSELTLVSLEIMLIIMGPLLSFSSIEWNLSLFFVSSIVEEQFVFLIKDGGWGERETTCMHASYQERKGDCRVLDCPASKVLFTVGSSCLAHLTHKWSGSVFFFFLQQILSFFDQKFGSFWNFFLL
jgi:hypothetical protein